MSAAVPEPDAVEQVARLAAEAATAAVAEQLAAALQQLQTAREETARLKDLVSSFSIQLENLRTELSEQLTADLNLALSERRP